ncbi:MAG: DUF2550 domain-containing protein [Nocardioidaceae bacterium]
MADSAGLLLALLAVPVLVLVVRRRFLSRHRGTFELSVNRVVRASGARGWTLGLGRYSGDRLEWFRVFSFSPRPKRTFGRGALEIVHQRRPIGSEQFAIYTGHVVVECRDAGRPIQLALSTQSLTGLMAWLESAPPGQSIGRVV